MPDIIASLATSTDENVMSTPLPRLTAVAYRPAVAQLVQPINSSYRCITLDENVMSTPLPRLTAVAYRPAGTASPARSPAPAHPCYCALIPRWYISVNQRVLLLLAGDVEVNPGPWAWKKLNEVSSKELDKVLSKFGMITKTDASINIKINVLQCSMIYHKYFAKYNVNQLLVAFGKKGVVMELKAEDESVRIGNEGIDREIFPVPFVRKKLKTQRKDSGVKATLRIFITSVLKYQFQKSYTSS